MIHSKRRFTHYYFWGHRELAFTTWHMSSLTLRPSQGKLINGATQGLTPKCQIDYFPRGHGTRKTFALPTQPSRDRLSAPLSEWTANKKTMRWNLKKLFPSGAKYSHSIDFQNSLSFTTESHS